MNKNDLQLKSEVMERVRSIHFMRTVMRPLLIKAAFLLVAFTAIFLVVSVPDVIKNLLQVPAMHSPQYLFDSFLQTQAPVQVILLSTTLLFILLVRDIIKNLKNIGLYKIV